MDETDKRNAERMALQDSNIATGLKLVQTNLTQTVSDALKQSAIDMQATLQAALAAQIGTLQASMSQPQTVTESLAVQTADIAKLQRLMSKRGNPNQDQAELPRGQPNPSGLGSAAMNVDNGEAPGAAEHR